MSTESSKYFVSFFFHKTRNHIGLLDIYVALHFQDQQRWTDTPQIEKRKHTRCRTSRFHLFKWAIASARSQVDLAGKLTHIHSRMLMPKKNMVCVRPHVVHVFVLHVVEESLPLLLLEFLLGMVALQLQFSEIIWVFAFRSNPWRWSCLGNTNFFNGESLDLNSLVSY